MPFSIVFSADASRQHPHLLHLFAYNNRGFPVNRATACVGRNTHKHREHRLGLVHEAVFVREKRNLRSASPVRATPIRISGAPCPLRNCTPVLRMQHFSLRKGTAFRVVVTANSRLHSFDSRVGTRSRLMHDTCLKHGFSQNSATVNTGQQPPSTSRADQSRSPTCAPNLANGQNDNLVSVQSSSS